LWLGYFGKEAMMTGVCKCAIEGRTGRNATGWEGVSEARKLETFVALGCRPSGWGWAPSLAGRGRGCGYVPAEVPATTVLQVGRCCTAANLTGLM